MDRINYPDTCGADPYFRDLHPVMVCATACNAGSKTIQKKINFTMKKIFLFTAIILILFVSCTGEKEPWRDLVDDKLEMWEQLNGTAEYSVVDGAIVGKTVLSSPNSFLCTKEKFSDFILEFDVLVDPVMNSGVQIRSESLENYNNGRVHGYQVEIDPEPRAWSGGIYDEARRLWLYPLDRNPEGRKAFINNQYNHFRVEAIGNSIRTWVNNIPCADLVDDMTPEGFIALQVHGIGNDQSKIAKEVIWKNIRILTEDAQKYATPWENIIPQNSYLVNRLSELESEQGWKLLWDGQNYDQWRSLNGDSFPEQGWTGLNGELRLEGNGGNIVTRDKFTDFELILDFKYEKGGNSGIKYFVNGDQAAGEGWDLGCEYQIIDSNNPDNLMESHRIGGLYDLLAPVSPRDNGAGTWNRARIVVRGDSVEHWLNNQLTVKYLRRNDEWRKMVEESKYNGITGFGEADSGRIMLQDHGHPVSFRTIKIREL